MTWLRGPLGSTSTSRGTWRLMRSQSCTVGRGKPAAWAIAGMCNSKLVEPPKAACTTIALWMAPGVMMCLVVILRFWRSRMAWAEAVASSSQIGCPEGARAEWGKAIPNASATTWDVAAVPRNWQPPPGDPQARHPRAAASWSDNSPWAKRAPMVWTLPASSPSVGGKVTPPGTRMVGRLGVPAKAMSMAGSPLSQVATPITAWRVGSERISRRKTIAASLRNGRLSNIPSVPWLRPSQGSVT